MTEDDIEARIRLGLALAFPPVESGDVPLSGWARQGQRTRRQRVTVLGAVAASVLVIALIAATVTVFGRVDRNPRHTATGSGPGSSLVGTMWLLTRIDGTHGTVDLARDHPSSVNAGLHGAWFHLSHNGSFAASDRINGFSGTYTLVTTRLLMRAGPQTFAALSPQAPDWMRLVVLATQAVTRAPGEVAVGGTAAHLVLGTDGYVLTFRNGGSVPDDPSLQGPTPTPDAHGDFTTPDDAVRATCPAAKILGDHGAVRVPPPVGYQVTVGWQESGQQAGIGWNALVTGTGTGYRVTDCKKSSITHG